LGEVKEEGVEEEGVEEKEVEVKVKVTLSAYWKFSYGLHKAIFCNPIHEVFDIGFQGFHHLG